MFKRALVSVSNKTGLLDLVKPLVEHGCEIVSTGGTAQFLRNSGIKIKEVSEVTGFPEMMDGRVRTLHPKIHMGLLARSHVPEDLRLLKEHGVEPFDLVVVNLYPFEESFKKGIRGDELVEQIDIGGPSMLRAAAKSCERVTVVCDPEDYGPLLEETLKGLVSITTRRRLAAKVFRHTAFYDALVAQAMETDPWQESSTLTTGFRKKSHLRYGENPHQTAVWYETPFHVPLSLSAARQHQGKELSYNNILDLEAAVGAVADYNEPACVIVKHLTPCGVALDDTIEGAYLKAFEADSVSAFGGIVALNRKLTVVLAHSLVGPFLECVICPSIEEDALKVLSAKKNLRVLEMPDLEPSKRNQCAAEAAPIEVSRLEFRSLRGGLLAQTTDFSLDWPQDGSWKWVGPEPTADVKRDMIFAQKVVRHVKSNAIVVVRNLQTLGMCGGQTNRVDSVKWALQRAQGRGENLVLGSDAFFPFRDSLDIAAKAGVKWIIQPGGSLRDQEVEQAAKEHNIGMVITGRRHFKH